MEEDLNLDIIKETQKSLGKYVKRPPLTDKLLKKPPFRFLHDIITSVLKSTGFFRDLFEENELISDNVKDRESKISFLNKVISVLSTTLGKPLSIKPSKIIAGQEPEKTNELLQNLALALDNNLSSDEAVKQFKESVKVIASSDKIVKDNKSIKKSTDVRKVTSKGSDKSIKSEKTVSNTTKSRQKDNTIVKKDSVPKKSSLDPKVVSKRGPEKVKQANKNNTTIANSSNKNLNDESLQNIENTESVDLNLELTQDQNPTITASDIDNVIDVIPQVNDSNKSNNKEYSLSQETPRIDEDEHKEQSKIENNKIEDGIHPDNDIVIDSNHREFEHKEENTNISNELPQKIEVENIQKNIEKNNFREDTQEAKVTDTSSVKRPSSVRPSSSRPGAPRLREKHDSIITSAENLVGGKINIIAEKTTDEEEDESTILIVANAENLKNIQEEEDQLQISSDHHGHLVKQILDAQKEFTQTTGKTEIERHFGAQKARDVVNQEMEQIRLNVQALSRIANPLGKLLDHIQEDVEVMRQELQQWTMSYEDASKELLKQKIANEEYLLPLYARIKQLDLDITEKHDKINDLKIVIHKNASRIDKLLTSGNV